MPSLISIGHLLRPFCAADPSKLPGLAYPVYVPGPGATTLTFCSDGSSIALWTTGRLGRYKDFALAGCPDGFSPLEWRGLFRSGASTPLPLPRQPDAVGEVWWLGAVGLVPAKWMLHLQEFDAVWLGGGGAGKPVNGRWEWLSFVATVDKRVFYGVLKGGGER